MQLLNGAIVFLYTVVVFSKIPKCNMKNSHYFNSPAWEFLPGLILAHGSSSQAGSPWLSYVDILEMCLVSMVGVREGWWETAILDA